MLAPQLKINPYLIFNYKKNPDFLLSKSISVDNNNFTISFTKLIDNKQTYNILYAIGNKFSKDKIDKHVIYNNFYIDKNDEYEQLSTFSYSQAEGCKKFFKCDFVNDKVKLQKTSELFSKHNIKEIDFLIR